MADQERALGRVLRQGDRGVVGVRGFGGTAEAAQQVGADGVVAVEAVEVEAVEDGERRSLMVTMSGVTSPGSAPCHAR
jgi:hypothetical protein